MRRDAIRWTSVLLASAAGMAVAPAAAQNGETSPVMLQWFETPWDVIERRMPDVFAAGYGSFWLPPPNRGRSTLSVGYDCFDRFDFGGPGYANGTTYGTVDSFDAMVDSMHAANSLVYIDTILNHNSFRESGEQFQIEGGWPGFWMEPSNPVTFKQPTDPWGDFHHGVASGYLQSENPGGPRYDLLVGDLVALVDINQASVNNFIRHPVAQGNPLNIPAGQIRNRPSPDNFALYPDEALTPMVVNNPGTARNPGSSNFTFHPFNTADPMAGDPYVENATGLLMRWSQWAMAARDVDGFRLDAAKHAPSWFWDTFFDSAVHMRRTTPDGRQVNPFSFVESVAGNFTTFNEYVRKDSFADRDALDLGGAGQLRDILNNPLFETWGDVLSEHIDTADDGFNNGTVGVNHMFSHDNGTIGDGGSVPPIASHKAQGWPMHAYFMLRPGPALVYLNGRAINRASGLFSPRGGTSVALGLDPDPNQDGNPSTGEGTLNPVITNLVQIRNQYGRGQFFPLNATDATNPGLDDVIVYERSTPQFGGASYPSQYTSNLLVAANKRYDSGIDTRNVQTTFPAGTRLHELTGNAADPAVDPAGVIPEVLVVDPSGRVTISIPRNVTGTTETNKGFVVYGPAVPEGQMQFRESGQVVTNQLAPDNVNTPWFLRRITPVTVITEDTFEIEVQTQQADPNDPATDDFAAFRIGEGYVDYNNNGGADFDFQQGVLAGYESFLTESSPLFTGGTGTYRQTIDTTQLSEGFHYISALAFRNRPANSAPLFRDFREVIYVDRVGPTVEGVDLPTEITSPQTTFDVRATDPTTLRMHMLWNVPDGTDPLSLVDPFNRAVQLDRFDYELTINTPTPTGVLTVIAFERSGNTSRTDFQIGTAATCDADVTTDGTSNGVPDGVVTLSDFSYYLGLWGASDPAADVTTDGTSNGIPDGNVTLSDFSFYLGLWGAGCP